VTGPHCITERFPHEEDIFTDVKVLKCCDNIHFSGLFEVNAQKSRGMNVNDMFVSKTCVIQSNKTFY